MPVLLPLLSKLPVDSITTNNETTTTTTDDDAHSTQEQNSSTAPRTAANYVNFNNNINNNTNSGGGGGGGMLTTTTTTAITTTRTTPYHRTFALQLLMCCIRFSMSVDLFDYSFCMGSFFFCWFSPLMHSRGCRAQDIVIKKQTARLVCLRVRLLVSYAVAREFSDPRASLRKKNCKEK